MAEDVDKDQQTEQASDKRLEDLRKDGTLLKSSDVISTVAFIASVSALVKSSSVISQATLGFADRIFRFQDRGQALVALEAFGFVLRTALLPIFTAAATAAAIAGVVQTRGFFSLGLIAPKPSRLNPADHIMSVLPSPTMLKEISKSLLKMFIVGFVVQHVLRDEADRFTRFASLQLEVAVAEVVRVIMRIVTQATMAFIALAAFDYFLAWRKFKDKSMMSKQELKDEHKSEEGDPYVKARMRGRMRQMRRKRALSEVKNATVLVTNPTHYAVALRYVPGEDAAPMLLAKGADELALKMRAEARKYGIPIVENRPLARALYAQGKEGRAIPIDLYQAAAGVIAHVLRIKGGKN